MIIKKKSSAKKQKTYFGIFVKLYFYVSLIFLVAILFLYFNTGYWNNYKRPFLDRLYVSSVNNYLNIFKIGFHALKGTFITLPELNLNVSFPNIVKLENDRNSANKQKFAQSMAKYNFLLVPGAIDHDNKSYNIDLRIKGDRDIHFKEKKYSSYRIYLKDNARIFNIRKFSIMKPRARNYVHEWIFHELLGENELIKLKYKFINLMFNGGDQGLYVFEEGFDKILLERNKRRNGPIFSIHENFSDGDDLEKIKFEVYNKNYWQNTENLKLSEIAVQKLRDFFEDKKRVDEIFDIDKWAWFFAASDINSSHHALLVKSVKYYYNPIIGKFEPIGFDAHRRIINYSKYVSNWEKLTSDQAPSSFESANKCLRKINLEKKALTINCNLVYKFFYNKKGELNSDFYNKYRNSILKIGSQNFLDTFFESRRKQIDKINSKIYGDYFFVDNIFYYGPGLYYYKKNDIYQRANYLLKTLKDEPEKVFIQQEEQKILVFNESINNNNFIIKQLDCYENLGYEKKNIILNYNFKDRYGNIDKIDLANYTDEKNIACKSALIINKFNNKEIVKTIDTLNNYQEITYKDSYFDRYKKYFLLEGNIIKLRENITLIDEDITIPKELIVKIYPGQKITLINNAFIFSDSPWLVGGKGEKVIISGQKENFGGGVIISETKSISKFTNTYFSYLRGVSKDINILSQQYIFLGAININYSEVIFKDVVFKEIEAEDALNIINSKFKILNSYFDKIKSDAIDVDFGNGEISNSIFKNVQNDAIDFSGSKVNLSNINFSYIGDKLVSVGENSIANISNVVGKNSFVGLASKDGSIVKGNNIYFDNINIPFASYIKKSEFDRGVLKLDDVTYKNFLVPYLRDQHSLLEIDNDTKKKVNKDILSIIYNKNINFLKNN